MTNRRITPNILRHARRLPDRIVHVVAKHAAGAGLLAELARPAGEHEFVGQAVFFRVEHVAAFAAEAEGDLFLGFCWGWGAVGGGRGEGGGGGGGHGVGGCRCLLLVLVSYGGVWCRDGVSCRGCCRFCNGCDISGSLALCFILTAS